MSSTASSSSFVPVRGYRLDISGTPPRIEPCNISDEPILGLILKEYPNISDLLYLPPNRWPIVLKVLIDPSIPIELFKIIYFPERGKMYMSFSMREFNPVVQSGFASKPHLLRVRTGEKWQTLTVLPTEMLVRLKEYLDRLASGEELPVEDLDDLFRIFERLRIRNLLREMKTATLSETELRILLTEENPKMWFIRSRLVPIDYVETLLEPQNVRIIFPAGREVPLLLATEPKLRSPYLRVLVKQSVLPVLEACSEKPIVRVFPKKIIDKLMSGEPSTRLLKLLSQYRKEPTIMLIPLPEECLSRLFPDEFLRFIRDVEKRLETGKRYIVKTIPETYEEAEEEEKTNMEILNSPPLPHELIVRALKHLSSSLEEGTVRYKSRIDVDYPSSIVPSSRIDIIYVPVLGEESRLGGLVLTGIGSSIVYVIEEPTEEGIKKTYGVHGLIKPSMVIFRKGKEAVRNIIDMLFNVLTI